MQVYGHDRQWELSGDAAPIDAILKTRDSVGGGEFWFSEIAGGYPCMAVRTSGDLAEIHYSPENDHPGLRFMSDANGLPSGECTTFCYIGSDPTDGTDVPNEFVVPLTIAVAVAREFLANPGQLPSGEWFEL